MHHRAVIFDLGGVVLGSPLHAIAAYERAHGVPQGFVNRVVVDAGPQGAWQRLERGLLTQEEFVAAFEADCLAAGRQIDASALLASMAEAARPRAEMLDAVREIRGRGILAVALTNNWASEARDDGTRAVREHFDAFFESCALGLRKPDPRIYAHVCAELAIRPSEAIFLDDIGRNLKTARQLGMATIKVEGPDQALDELETLLGFGLRPPPGGQAHHQGIEIG